ncbi:hypothetical protein [Rhodococcus sp. NCIMB 12038]|uniref:hypothetical protein n=1 Tax=Rhodococcus sp. NCIMB 12038 TaxID=933800 RepID=UPI00211AEC7E|nr:hypothetical protein [Rhodococcus sp. NCIMB 12038]
MTIPQLPVHAIELVIASILGRALQSGRGIWSGVRPDADSHAAVSGGDWTEDLLTWAVTEALAAGMSCAQIAVQLGVPPPATRDHAAVTDHDWQDAIVAHENARAARLRDLSENPKFHTPTLD